MNGARRANDGHRMDGVQFPVPSRFPTLSWRSLIRQLHITFHPSIGVHWHPFSGVALVLDAQLALRVVVSFSRRLRPFVTRLVPVVGCLGPVSSFTSGSHRPSSRIPNSSYYCYHSSWFIIIIIIAIVVVVVVLVHSLGGCSCALESC